MSNGAPQSQWASGQSIVPGSMSPEHVIVEIQQAESPLSKPDAPVYFKTILLLLMEDGREVYACSECPYTSPKVGLVRHHGRTDHPRAGQAPPSAVRGGRDPQTMTVKELLATAAEVNELRDAVRKLRGKLERAEANDGEWKRRALAAEKDLALLRQALRGAMGEK